MKQVKGQENSVKSHNKHPFSTTQEMTLHMDITKLVNTEIKLIIFFITEDGEAVYSQQKQHLELTVAQIISFSWQNSGLN